MSNWKYKQSECPHKSKKRYLVGRLDNLIEFYTFWWSKTAKPTLVSQEYKLLPWMVFVFLYIHKYKTIRDIKSYETIKNNSKNTFNLFDKGANFWSWICLIVTDKRKKTTTSKALHFSCRLGDSWGWLTHLQQRTNAIKAFQLLMRFPLGFLYQNSARHALFLIYGVNCLELPSSKIKTFINILLLSMTY